MFNYCIGIMGSWEQRCWIFGYNNRTLINAELDGNKHFNKAWTVTGSQLLTVPAHILGHNPGECVGACVCQGHFITVSRTIHSHLWTSSDSWTMGWITLNKITFSVPFGIFLWILCRFSTLPIHPVIFVPVGKKDLNYAQITSIHLI